MSNMHTIAIVVLPDMELVSCASAAAVNKDNASSQALPSKSSSLRPGMGSPRKNDALENGPNHFVS